MSYEGTTECLCAQGHHWEVPSNHSWNYGSREGIRNPYVCSVCNTAPTHLCEIDETNGYYAEDPSTFEGPKKLIGFHDIPAEDHRGNKYVLKADRFEPVGPRWIAAQLDVSETAEEDDFIDPDYDYQGRPIQDPDDI